MRYAFTTQARSAWEKPRSRRIDGSATLTMVASTTIMRNPMQRMIKDSHRDVVAERWPVLAVSMMVMKVPPCASVASLDRPGHKTHRSYPWDNLSTARKNSPSVGSVASPRPVKAGKELDNRAAVGDPERAAACGHITG